MEPTFKLSNIDDKASAYKEFISKFELFIESEKNAISVFANTSAALKEAFDFFWVGFYIVNKENLYLGPFQGNVACTNIKYGRGVCGTAWAKERTIIVDDVEKFPGHIACSSLSRSEIVIPVFHNGKIIAVLDIDSDKLEAFNDIDKIYLEQLTDIISNNIDI